MPAFNTTSRIAFGGTDIDYAGKLRDNIQVDDYDHVIHTTKSGATVVYKRDDQEIWHEDVIVSEANSEVIRTWITNRSAVVFTPDLVGAPGVTHTITIMNTNFPFFYWGSGKFRATLVLRKQ